MAENTQTTYNHDVAGLHRRINRFMIEAQKSGSSSTSQMSEWDVERILTYLGAIETYASWVVSQPHLDLPETSPREIPLDANPVLAIVENESISDIVRMMEIARDEITKSQSSRQSNGLIKFDENRLLGVVGKIRAFITDYVQQVTPLDLPESSPMREVSGLGRNGV